METKENKIKTKSDCGKQPMQIIRSTHWYNIPKLCANLP